MKQAIKKKTFSKPSIKDLKASMGFGPKVQKEPVKMSELKMSSAEKETEFIVLPKAFEDALKLPGIPKGYLTIATGWSNTGKSTIKNCLIAACQREGIVPVVFETEGNFDWKYAIDCGVQATPIYGEIVDDETGEVTEGIIDYEGDFYYLDGKTLAEKYGKRDYQTGKETTKQRSEAVLEDIAYCINEFLDMQADGEFPYPLCFIWDSIGSIQSYKSYTSKSGNNMFDAGAISQAFNNIINNRIPSSRKVSEPYTNTFFCVNKIWNDSMNSMGGVPSIELKGGKTMYYGARLIIHLGGVAKAATKVLKATAKGENFNYGIVTKVKVTKNQLPTPYNVTYEGTMCCVHNGIISESEIDAYKKENIKHILENLENQRKKDGNETVAEITEADLNYTEEETFEE
jgi:hypothetical protein